MDADAWTPATQAGVGAVRMAARRVSSGVQARSDSRQRVVSVDPVTPGQRGAQSRRRRPWRSWDDGPLRARMAYARHRGGLLAPAGDGCRHDGRRCAAECFSQPLERRGGGGMSARWPHGRGPRCHRKR